MAAKKRTPRAYPTWPDDVVAWVTAGDAFVWSEPQPDGDGNWTCSAEQHIDGHPDWFATGRFVADPRGETRLVELHVLRRPSGTGAVTTAMLRAVKLPRLQRAAETTLTSAVARGATQLHGISEAFKGRAQPGRPSDWSDARLALLVQEYVELAEQSAPLVALAASRNLSYGRVRDLIARARTRKLLSPTVPGRKGGTLTEKAITILKGAHDGPR